MPDYIDFDKALQVINRTETAWYGESAVTSDVADAVHMGIHAVLSW